MIHTLLLCAAVAPQGEPSAGNFVGSPKGLFLDRATAQANTSSGDPSRALLKLAGLQDSMRPREMDATPGLPDFSATAPWTAASAGVVDMAIDAFSTDINFVSVRVVGGQAIASARFDGGQGWSAVLVVPTAATVAIPGSTLGNDPAGAGSVYQYVFDDSTGVDAGLLGRVVRTESAAEIHLDPPPSQEPEIAALDVFVPYLRDPSGPSAMRDQFQGVVFSVPSGVSVPPAWLAWHASSPPHTGITPTQSGANVYVADWLAGSWQPVQLLLAPQQLGLADGDDVTALAYDRAHHHLLFSSNDPSQDPIMFVQIPPGQPITPPTPLLTGSLTPLSRVIGIQDPTPPVRVAVVGALCSIDPRIPGSSSVMGMLVGNQPQPYAHFGVFRHEGVMNFVVSAPFSPQSAKYGLLELALGSPSPTPSVPVSPFIFAVNQTTYLDAPLWHAEPLPPPLTAIGDFRWRFFDGSFVEVGQSNWNRIDL